MSEKIQFTTTVPKNVPKFYVIEPRSVNYTKPKLHVPKDANGRATVERPWYVYFYFRNPKTGKFDSKSKFIWKRGINRKYKTVQDRRKFGNQLIEVITRLLEEGYNPYEKTVFYEKEATAVQHLSLRDALLYAYDLKKKEIARSTKSDWNSRVNTFLAWATKEKLADKTIHDITSIHIATFLNSLANDGHGAKNINNYRGCLSALWSKLANDMIVAHNPVSVLKKRKEKSIKNKPFTPDEIKQIGEYLKKEDPHLLLYLRFVGFAFLRPVEIARLRIGDIDLKRMQLTVQTKTEARATVRIVPQLADELDKIGLSDFDKTNFVFTRDDKPGQWINARTKKEAAENTRTKAFTDRFNKVKKHFDFGDEYGIYSFRHSFAVNLYQSLIESGLTTMEAELKMLPITRHKTVSGLRNYLRDIGASLPKNYGDRFTVDF